MKNKCKKILAASLGILFFVGGLQNVKNIESMQLQVFIPENLSCTGTEAEQFVEDFQEQYQTEIAVCMLNKKTTVENTILGNTVEEEFYQLKDDWYHLLRSCKSSVMVEIMDSFVKALVYGGGVITAFGYLNGMEEMGISKRGD